MSRPQLGAPPENGAARSIVPPTPRAYLNNNTNPENSRSAEVRPAFRLLSWFPFFFNVVGCATVAQGDQGDLVVDDVLICAIGTEVFALVKRPATMTESEWGELSYAAVALVRKADPGALAGTTDLFGAGR
jgi:hypothetical protein